MFCVGGVCVCNVLLGAGLGAGIGVVRDCCVCGGGGGGIVKNSGGRGFVCVCCGCVSDGGGGGIVKTGGGSKFLGGGIGVSCFVFDCGDTSCASPVLSLAMISCLSEFVIGGRGGGGDFNGGRGVGIGGGIGFMSKSKFSLYVS